MRFPFISRQARLTKAPHRNRLSRQIGRGIEQLEDLCMLSTIPVTLTTDAVTPTDLDGGITLREAITYVNTKIVPEGDRALFDYANLGTNDKILFDSSIVDPIVLSAGQLEINKTVKIDATALPDGITIDADGGSRVFYINNPGPDENDIYNITLAGLTITGGNATGHGGGIYFETSDSHVFFSITDSIIINNHATGYGGGIYVSAIADDYEFNLVDTTIGETYSGNTAVCGGGAYLYYSGVANIENCMFQANEAVGSYEEGGGGLYADVYSNSNDQGKLTINNSMFEGNIATLAEVNNNYGGGGGIFVHLRDKQSDNISELNLLSSTVSGNTATNCDGGGVWVNSKYGTFNCEQNTISGNSALFGAGGGLWMELNSDFGVKLTADLTDNTISGNSAGAGGGLWAAAGMKRPDGNPSVIVNLLQNTISGNIVEYDPNVPHSGEGGGLWIGAHMDNEENYDCVVTANIDHTTITANHSSNGGGFYSEVPQYQEQYVTTTLSHTIVSGNDDGEEVPYNDPNNIAGAINSSSSYNLIGEGPATHDANGDPSGDIWTPGKGNIDDEDNDPGLRDLWFYGGPTQTHMPYSTSEVIDKGNPNASGIPDCDQRGEPYNRVLDGDGVDGERIDIGAVEYNDETNTEGPPKIVDVIISGSQSVHDDYSFAEVIETEGDAFSTVPVGGADTIEIVFSEWVNVEESDFYLYDGLNATQYTDLVDFVFDETTFTARWQFEPFPTDMFEIRLNKEEYENYIYDIDENLLDGECDGVYFLNNEAPQLPSGDGDPGGEFYFTFVILPGDADLDNDVDGADFWVWITHYGMSEGATFIDGDFDGDGDVDGDDLVIWQANFGLIWDSWGTMAC